MKLKTILFLIAAGFSLSPVFAHAQKAGAYGVTFIQPPGWTMTTETNPAWTKFRLRQAGGLPKVMIQIYSSNVTPEAALNAYVRAHREKFSQNHWNFNESSTQETFGQRVYDGRELFYQANDTNYCQRFFALNYGQRTVLVMSLAQVQDDWNYWGYGNDNVPDDLGPIAASLQGKVVQQHTAE